jgi:hypothetical protein
MNRKRDRSDLSQDSSGIPDKSPRAKSSSSGESDSDEPIEVDPEFEEEGAEEVSAVQPADMPEVDQSPETSRSYAEATTKKPKLFVYASEFTQSPFRFHIFAEFRKILASKFAKAVCERSISSEINCDQILFNREQGNAVVTCHNPESATWLKRIISTIKVEKTSFRAWEEGERPKKFDMRIFLPDAYQQVGVAEVGVAIQHFNAGVVDSLEVKKETALKSGRLLEVEVGPLFYQYCRERKGKIRFMMGPLDCSPPTLHRDGKKSPENPSHKSPSETSTQINQQKNRTVVGESKTTQIIEGTSRDTPLNPGMKKGPQPFNKGLKPTGNEAQQDARMVLDDRSTPVSHDIDPGTREKDDQDAEGSGWQTVQKKK